jgi:hypothetical protein
MITNFEITMGNPQFKILFLILPLIFILHFYFIYHVKRRALKFGNFSAMKRVHTNTIISMNLTTLFFVLLMAAALILSVLDISIWVSGDVANSDYYVLLDSGASMNARDIYPDRFGVAKQMSSELVKRTVESKIGFISFAGTIIKNEPLTDDKSKILNSIEDAKIENTGTDMGLAIVSAIQGFGASNNSKTIILVSDGHDTVGTPLKDALVMAKEKHIKIIAFGIGTKEGGEFLEVPDSEGVISRLDEEALYTLSKETNSVYTNIKQDYDINAVMETIVKDRKSGVIEYRVWDKLVLFALGILFFIWILDNTRFRIFP